MIIFIDNPQYIQTYKLINHPSVVYNLSSLYSGFQSIAELITKISLVNNSALPTNLFVESVDFDIQYANSLLNNSTLFNKLMTIMHNSYEGFVVFILIQRDPYRDCITESLIKFIQQRYGYNCWLINDPEDLNYIKEDSYTPMGLLTLGEDLKRYNESNINNISIE